jgi:hypothetical protein
MILMSLETIRPQELELLSKLREWNLIEELNNFLTRPDAHNRLVTGVMGWQWEDNFRTICDLRGLSCTEVRLGEKHDWIINNYRVQCKFSNAFPRIDIRNKNKESNRRYKKDDFDFLALRVHPVSSTFIIPSSRLIEGDTGFLKLSLDINEFADCIDNFEVLHATQDLPELLNEVRSQDENL